MNMLYISKGLVQEHSTEALLLIRHCGCDYQLTGLEAAIWLDGQTEFASTDPSWATEHLYRMGLIDYEKEDSPLSRYRILSRCICCPCEGKLPLIPLRSSSTTILTWLKKAGLRLTTAELIYLTESRILPCETLLSEENKAALIARIYTRNNIRDNLLEHQMERAVCRDQVVETLLYLLKKKRLVLI